LATEKIPECLPHKKGGAFFNVQRNPDYVFFSIIWLFLSREPLRVHDDEGMRLPESLLKTTR
jgi:hypothetical protein